MAYHILIVEDERKIAQGLQTYLQGSGYHATIASDGKTGLDMALRDQPDLILLDIMLPEIDGFEVCRRLRHNSSIPIIMLTARVEDMDTILGLELGADDYIAKPFSPRQVVARIKAVLRRAHGQVQLPAILRRAGIELDTERRSVSVEGQPITLLTPTEFDLLATLMRAPGRAWTRTQLLDAVLGDDSDAYDRTIDAHIKNLRRKIEPEPAQPRYVLTVYGIGYKFTEVDS